MVTAKLISAFVFATRIVQSLFYLNPKFQASIPSSVTVQPGLCRTGSETPNTGFLRTRPICLQVYQSAHSPKGWNTFAKRLSGNTEFITSRFIEKAKESSGNVQSSPGTKVLERSPSFSRDKSVQRSSSQTSESQTDSSSTTRFYETSDRIDSGSHHYQTLSDSSSTIGYETPKEKYSDILQNQTEDYKTRESKSSTMQHYYDAETDSSWKSSKSNSAIHSRGSSYDYDNSYTYSGTSSNVSINILLFYLLIYVSIYFFMTFLETGPTVETGPTLTLLW